jgi:hypothetical protein
VSAFLARAVESDGQRDGVTWQIARLTIELTRPVPVGRPLGLDTEVERPGRKVSLVSAVLRDGDVEVARVRALRIRDAAITLPDGANQIPEHLPFPPLFLADSGSGSRGYYDDTAGTCIA